MALLFVDSFDHVGTNSQPSALGKWASGVGPPMAVNFTTPRTGSHCLYADNGYELVSKTFVTAGNPVAGFAFRMSANPNGFTDVFSILEDTTVHVAIGITSGNLFTVKRGTTVLATGTTVLLTNTWYYIEFKAVIHDTTGSYELRIDGVTELTATNVDTRNSGIGVWNKVKLSGCVSSTFYDDFYLCDTTGSIRNNFLGSVKIETIYPQTDATAVGSNQGLTPSTGTDHGALVDETTPNTTDYNSAATVGLKDTYNYPAMTLTGTILGVQLNMYIQKSDAAARSVCGVARSGGADFDSSNYSPTTGFTYLTPVFAQNPNGNVDWTPTSVNAAEFGMKVTV